MDGDIGELGKLNALLLCGEAVAASHQALQAVLPLRVRGGSLLAVQQHTRTSDAALCLAGQRDAALQRKAAHDKALDGDDTAVGGDGEGGCRWSNIKLGVTGYLSDEDNKTVMDAVRARVCV